MAGFSVSIGGKKYNVDPYGDTKKNVVQPTASKPKTTSIAPVSKTGMSANVPTTKAGLSSLASKLSRPIGGGNVTAKTSMPSITLDSKTGKNISKNIDPISRMMDPTGVGTGVNKGIFSLNSKDNLKSGIGKILDNSLAGDPKIRNSLYGSSSSPSQKIFGKSMTPSGQFAPKPNGTNGEIAPGDMQGFMPGEPQTSPPEGGVVTLPSYDKRSWEELISKNETNSDAISPIQRRYALMQSNLKMNEGSMANAEQSALNRRFAAIGAMNSGAAIKNQRLQSDTSNRRYAESRNALDAAQAGDEQAAIESMNARNMAREQQRLGSEESYRGYELEKSKIQEGARQFEKEMDLNTKISNSNLAVAADAIKNNKIGFLGGLWNDIFGSGISINGLFGKK